jgi:hypothetical protein
MDRRLHGERCVSGAPQPVIGGRDAAALPAGSMFARGRHCFAVGSSGLLRWQFAGYTALSSQAAGELLSGGGLVLLTPRSTVAALRNGYRPICHFSADP